MHASRLLWSGPAREHCHRELAHQFVDLNARSALPFLAGDQALPGAGRNVDRRVSPVTAQPSHESGHHDQKTITDKADRVLSLRSDCGERLVARAAKNVRVETALLEQAGD